MSKKGTKEISNLEAWRNNAYAMKLAWSMSKKRVLLDLLSSCFDYGEWIFYDVFFIRYVVAALDNQKSFSEMARFIGICCIVFMGINAFFRYQENVFIPISDMDIYQKLYRKLFDKSRNVELSCFEDADFYNKYTMAMDGASTKITEVIKNIWRIITGTIAVVIVFYNMYIIDPYAMLFVVFPIIGNFVFGGIMNKQQLQLYQDDVINSRIVQYVNRVMYLPDYAKEIRLSKVFSLIRKKYEESVKRTCKLVDQYSPKLIVINALKNIFTFCIIFEGVLLYASYRSIVAHKISLADLAVLTSIMVSATWILIGLFDAIVTTMKNGLFVRNLRVFMEYKEKIPEDQDGIQPSDTIESIEFRNVTFSYKDEETIHNLSFFVKGGQNIALVGHNGAGKSTIIKLLLRLYDPCSGEILVNGRNIKEYNLRAYRNLFAAAFQDYQILALSIKDNVLMGRHFDNPDEAAKDALRKTGVLDKIESLPNGLDTILTKEFDPQGAVLSGGQYQKVIVARVFAQQAPVKVFDEPSSALDPIAEYDLYTNIMKESIGKTVFFISHRLSSVKNADVVFMLENGRIIEQGVHSELMKANGPYADMYTKQAMNYLATDDIKEVAL